MGNSKPSETIALPPPSLKGARSLEEALAARRSVREFVDRPLTGAELSQLLWAAQGITHPDGLRTAPTAGALYPLELYVANASGLFRYDPGRHCLIQHAAGDRRRALFEVALEQTSILQAPAVFLIAAVYQRTAGRYGRHRARRYVHMEVGHAAENLLLQAVALGLGGVPIGAFDDKKVRQVLRLPADERPLYLIPVGHPKV